MAQNPIGKVVTKIMMQLETAKIRPGEGLIETKSYAVNVRDGSICNMTASVLKMPALKLQEEEQLQDLHHPQNRMQNVQQCQHQTLAHRNCYQFPIS